MMGKPRIFTTLPVGMMSDPRPTALDLRCAMAIALRDGMSQVKLKGGGCYAKMATLAADVDTDVTNFSKSLSRLTKWGYVCREPQLMDKRRFTLRVNYPDPAQDGEQTNIKAEIVGKNTYSHREIVGEPEAENPRKPRHTQRHYSSLREELNSVETRELNSLKGPPFCTTAVSSLMSDRARPELDAPKGGRGSISLWEHLPSNIEALSLGAQVAKIERAYDAIGRNADSILFEERCKLTAWLFDISDTCRARDENATSQQALRLAEEIDP